MTVATDDENTPILGSQTEQTKKTNVNLICVGVFLSLIIFIFLALICMDMVETFVARRYPEFRVDMISANPFNVSVSTSQIIATWNISLSIKNPTWFTPMFYDVMDAMVFYKKDFLGGTMIYKPFSQYPNEQTLVHFSISTYHVVLSNKVAEAIDAERNGSGTANFNVMVLAPVRQDDQSYVIWLSCENLKVDFLSDVASGATSGAGRKCKVTRDYGSRHFKL